MNKINFALGAKKILSVNSLYKAGIYYAGGREVAKIYKSKEAKMTESYIKEQVELLNVPVNFPWVNKDTLFRMTIKVIFKTGFLLRDLDNTLKLVQDGIFRALDINDSHVVSIIADKVLLPNIGEEKILVCLEECDKTGVRFDYIPRPQVIWSEDIILDLPKVPEKRLIHGKLYSTDQISRADTFLYLITPDTLTFVKPMKIITKAIECTLGSSGFVLIIVESGNWNPDLEEFKNLINEQQKAYSGIKMITLEEKDITGENIIDKLEYEKFIVL